jgi:hypothetical protein
MTKNPLQKVQAANGEGWSVVYELKQGGSVFPTVTAVFLSDGRNWWEYRDSEPMITSKCSSPLRAGSAQVQVTAPVKCIPTWLLVDEEAGAGCKKAHQALLDMYMEERRQVKLPGFSQFLDR